MGLLPCLAAVKINKDIFCLIIDCLSDGLVHTMIYFPGNIRYIHAVFQKRRWHELQHMIVEIGHVTIFGPIMPVFCKGLQKTFLEKFWKSPYRNHDCGHCFL